jgi:ATP-dependent Clp protease ATP-binding subunit ClpA
MVMNVEEVASKWKKFVIGQDEAIDRMVPYIVRGIAGMTSPDRPVAAFFLMGITGSGKTKTAEALAHILQGSEKMLIRVNCGEYQGDHEVAKLTGAPPGYLGYSESQSSTVLNTMSLAAVVPNGPKLPIIIFDEIEKAHPAMGRILLEVLDKAELRLGNGQVVDFSKCIIFFTSNIGAKEMQTALNHRIGFADQPNGSVSKVAHSAFTKRFAPEFVNRIDEVIVYDTLTPEVVEKIAELELLKIQQYIGGKFTLS